ncbi:hypothetical protein DdX_13925 [Ditylenchus destructor]|uniref:Uncharacterized protein n=1 Tax=Ditylenchus destructor TaxID=166010 RepID=A0AAD4R2E6_9BILA|nr:hypothetical protein DdX_13925 [Ditylenchus destructor]
MIPYWCLLDILKFQNRNELERIQVTNRLLNNIVNKYFATYPLRVFPETMVHVQIRNGNFGLSFRKFRVGTCFMLDSRTWTHNNCAQECEHFYPFEVVRLFLCKNVRFKQAELYINDHHISKRYSACHIATLESISHVWAKKDLFIHDFSEKDPSSQSLILNSSSILQCRTLHVRDDRRRIQVLQYPNVYSLYALNTFGSVGSRETLPFTQQLIEQKALHRNSDTIFVFFAVKESVNKAVEFIKQNFFTSQDYCRLRLIITTFSPNHISEFREMNHRTNEVLELKHLSNEQAEKFNIRPFYDSGAMMIERYII